MLTALIGNVCAEGGGRQKEGDVGEYIMRGATRDFLSGIDSHAGDLLSQIELGPCFFCVLINAIRRVVFKGRKIVYALAFTAEEY